MRYKNLILFCIEEQCCQCVAEFGMLSIVTLLALRSKHHNIFLVQDLEGNRISISQIISLGCHMFHPIEWTVLLYNIALDTDYSVMIKSV